MSAEEGRWGGGGEGGERAKMHVHTASIVERMESVLAEEGGERAKMHVHTASIVERMESVLAEEGGERAIMHVHTHPRART